MKIRVRIFSVIAAVLFLYACTKDKGMVMRVETACNTPESISYSKDIQPLFNQYCLDCHAGASPKGNLNLESPVSYAKLTNAFAGYIDTINPKYSLLYSQLNSVSNPMPPSGKLDKCKIDLVLKWIEQKARNN